ncbi:prolactin family 6 subfamily a member 1 [Cricetulus griseus]
MISISRAWYHPLEKLVHEVAALNGASETMLLKVKEVEEKNQELLKKIKEILVRVHPGAEENVYPAWMGLAEDEVYVSALGYENVSVGINGQKLGILSLELLLQAVVSCLCRCIRRGTLLALLVSNLVVWENVASVPLCPSWDSSCQGSLNNMFDYALSLSYEIQNQAAAMLNDFGIFLLQEILTILGAWTDPLDHVVTELSVMEEAPTSIIAKANTVGTAMKGLQEGVRRILGKIYPRFKEVEEYPIWKGLASLQSPDEDLRVFAFNSLFQCLKRDSRKIDSNLKLLKCREEFNFEFSMSEEDKENVKVSGEYNEDDVNAIVREDEEDGTNFCFYIAGTLLMVLNLFLWEKVASVPMHDILAANGMVSLKDLLDRAITLSYNITELTAETQRMFLDSSSITQCLAVGACICFHQLLDEICRNAIKFHNEFSSKAFANLNKKYLKMLINYVGAWTSPLYHLTLELSAMPDAPETIISKANEIEENNKELLNDLRWILAKDSWSSVQCLAEDLCICFHQLLDEGYMMTIMVVTHLIIGELTCSRCYLSSIARLWVPPGLWPRPREPLSPQVLPASSRTAAAELLRTVHPARRQFLAAYNHIGLGFQQRLHLAADVVN